MPKKPDLEKLWDKIKDELHLHSYMFSDLNEHDWSDISALPYLTEEFMERNQDYLRWRMIVQCQKLSIPFIEKYLDKLQMKHVCQYQNLTQKFIEKYQNQVDWFYVSMYQKMSKQFIIKHRDKIIIEFLDDNNKIVLDDDLKIFLKLRGVI